MILMVALSALMLASCSKSNPNRFAIEGTCGGGIPDTAYFVHLVDPLGQRQMELFDTIYVKDNKFHWEIDTISSPHFIFLQAIFKDGTVCHAMVDFLLIPGNTAKIEVNNGYYTIDGEGIYGQWGDLDKQITEKAMALKDLRSKLQACESQEQFNQMYPEYMSAAQEYQAFPYNFARNNPDRAEGVLAFLLKGQYPLKDSLDIFPENALNGVLKPLVDFWVKTETERSNAKSEREAKAKVAAEATAEGKMFTDFEAEYDGKVQKLSDYVGKGKYVLVDFWASWCGPCRGEIPNLKDVYNKYKGAKFDVVGVASWDEPDDTKQAIAEEGVAYPQIINAQNAGTDAYGIMGIPEIILFAPDGTIVARGLRGSEIELAVKKALGK